MKKADTSNKTVPDNSYSDKNIELLLQIYQNMVKEVELLESLFPTRHFTLDGHLIGSIGEAIAKNRYGIELSNSSNPIFDGTINGHNVQIKTVQQNLVMIRNTITERSTETDYLLVIYLNKLGKYYEVYNGLLSPVIKSGCHIDKKGYLHVSINKLIEFQNTNLDCRIPQIKPVERMKSKYKNTSH